MLGNAKKILIETETLETFTLRMTGPHAVRLYCDRCRTMEEMLDLNVAADVSGAPARELIRRVESGVLHSPESTSGHLLVCRASLEREINDDPGLRPRGELMESGE